MVKQRLHKARDYYPKASQFGFLDKITEKAVKKSMNSKRKKDLERFWMNIPEGFLQHRRYKNRSLIKIRRPFTDSSDGETSSETISSLPKDHFPPTRQIPQ